MRVAIIGSGQLARLLALEGQDLNLEFVFATERDADIDAIDGLGEVVRFEANTSAEQLFQSLGQPDVVTTEKELTDLRLYRELQQFTRVHPNPRAVALASNRIAEKSFFRDLALPTPKFAVFDSAQGIDAAITETGLPCIIKSAENGYDGKNQWRITSEEDLLAFKSEYRGDAMVAEQFVSFEREVSMIAVRSAPGDIGFYSLTQNTHRNGILHQSVAPLPDAEDLEVQARDIAAQLLNALDYVGVLAVEFFVVAGELKLNEMAPRVHNSGHWTLNGSNCSQFENHLRAITSLPLKEPRSQGYNCMLNLIGRESPRHLETLKDTHVYWYNKAVRPGRKLGHINLNRPSLAALESAVEMLEQEGQEVATKQVANLRSSQNQGGGAKRSNF